MSQNSLVVYILGFSFSFFLKECGGGIIRNKHILAVNDSVSDYCHPSLSLLKFSVNSVLFLTCKYLAAQNFGPENFTLEDQGNQTFHVFLVINQICQEIWKTLVIQKSHDFCLFTKTPCAQPVLADIIVIFLYCTSLRVHFQQQEGS